MDKVKHLATAELNLIKLLSLLIIFLVGLAFAMHASKPKPSFFSYSQSKDLTQNLVPLDEPNISTAGLLRWASFAITSIYTLDFVYYEDTVQNMREFFTASGYDNYMAQLQATNKINDIAAQKLVVSAVLEGTPVVLSENILNGLHTWQVAIPLLITYQGASQNSTKESKLIVALVVRDTASPKGIGIAQIVEQVASVGS